MTSFRRAAAATFALGTTLALASCSGPSTPASSTTTGAGATATTTTTMLHPPAGTPVPAGFEPASVTFVSSATGFVIGVDPSCAEGSCVAVARTTDGGATWVALSAPPAVYVNRFGDASVAGAVSLVRFADTLDGWVFGPSLFATHDGGATWQRVDLGGVVLALEASGGFVDAVVSPCAYGQPCSQGVRLYQASVTGGAFASVLTAPAASSSVVTSLLLSLHAPVGFMSTGVARPPSPATLFATANLSDRSGWHPFTDPCTVARGEAQLTFVAPDSTRLYTLCSGQGAAGMVEKEVVRTENGKSAVAGTAPPAGDPEAIAATASGTVVVSAASGASYLYRSTDGGATWSTARTYDDGGIGFVDLGFTTATQGVVIHGVAGRPTNVTSQLLMTRDGGATWQVVAVG